MWSFAAYSYPQKKGKTQDLTPCKHVKAVALGFRVACRGLAT